MLTDFRDDMTAESVRVGGLANPFIIVVLIRESEFKARLTRRSKCDTAWAERYRDVQRQCSGQCEQQDAIAWMPYWRKYEPDCVWI
jgi:hypothetical protein